MKGPSCHMEGHPPHRAGFSMTEHQGYDSGHCWYYKLGGRILTPEEVCKEAEPKRSKQIIAAIEDCSHSQERNIERYIEVTKQVEYERRWLGPFVWDKERMWNEPTTAAMLKHNHIFYTHATLEKLKGLSRQMSLF